MGMTAVIVVEDGLAVSGTVKAWFDSMLLTADAFALASHLGVLLSTSGAAPSSGAPLLRCPQTGLLRNPDVRMSGVGADSVWGAATLRLAQHLAKNCTLVVFSEVSGVAGVAHAGPEGLRRFECVTNWGKTNILVDEDGETQVTGQGDFFELAQTMIRRSLPDGLASDGFESLMDAYEEGIEWSVVAKDGVYQKLVSYPVDEPLEEPPPEKKPWWRFW